MAKIGAICPCQKISAKQHGEQTQNIAMAWGIERHVGLHGGFDAIDILTGTKSEPQGSIADRRMNRPREQDGLCHFLPPEAFKLNCERLFPKATQAPPVTGNQARRQGFRSCGRLSR
ncbi:hypothetical protein [Caenibius tardaugens]|uniref:hypothetical protein n=1 Tax=Caenibius tardaugens TaxID=169176 RepID=UPI000F5DF127|nr:hypothetical protein [Caenibius tardaugens]AZI34635.1 hypothetical protein EGO55_00645 [Caenibius tardaugens NBRC 16725]